MPKLILKRDKQIDHVAGTIATPSANGVHGKPITVTSSGQIVRSVREMLFSESRKAANLSFESLINKTK